MAFNIWIIWNWNDCRFHHDSMWQSYRQKRFANQKLVKHKWGFIIFLTDDMDPHYQIKRSYYMKCPHCGKSFSQFSDTCPYCNSKLYLTSEYSNKIAEFLARPFRLGTLELVNCNLIFIIVINISIMSFIANGITFYALNSKVAWCQYAICGALSTYVILKGIATNRLKTLRYIRRAVSILLLAVSIADFAFRETFIGVLYFYPILLIILSVICFVFLITKRSSHESFGVTTAIDTALASLPLFVIRFLNVSAYSSGVFLSYISFGIAAMSFVNYLILLLMSLATRFKNSF